MLVPNTTIRSNVICATVQLGVNSPSAKRLVNIHLLENVSFIVGVLHLEGLGYREVINEGATRLARIIHKKGDSRLSN